MDFFKKNNLESSIVLILKALVLAILFLPLVLHSQFYFPFIVFKNVLFRIIVELMIGLYFILIALDKKYLPKMKNISLAVFIFLIITFLANIFGNNFYVSFWGDYERMSGFFHFLHVVGYFFILSSVFKNKRDWHQFFAFTIFTALIASAMGLSQKWNIQQLLRSSGGQRLTGPIGNAAFFAGYLLLHLFFVVYFIFKPRRFPGNFFSSVILVFNGFLGANEIYRRVLKDSVGFLYVIFSNWQLLIFFVMIELVALFYWLEHKYQYLKNISNKKWGDLLYNFPLFIIAGIFLYVIYHTQTRGSVLSLWVSIFIFLVFGFFLSAKRSGKIFYFFAATAIFSSQPLVYLFKNSAFIKNNAVLNRLSGSVTAIAFYLSLLSLVLICLFLIKKKKSKIIFSVLLVFILILPSFLYLIKDSVFISSVPVLNKIQTYNPNADITTEARLLTWKSSFLGMLERPILGWGQENFEIVFNKHFPAPIFKDSGSQIWFDRAHNVIFDVGVTTGFAGLISYLSIFAVAVIFLIKKYNSDRIFSGSILFVVLLFAYLVQNLFVFDTLNTEIIIYLILAFIAFTLNQKDEQSVEKAKVKKFNPLYGLVLLATLILIYSVNINTLKANHLLFDALMTKNSITDKVEGADNFLKAIEISPIGRAEAREQLATYAQDLIKANREESNLRSVVEIAAAEMESSIKERPDDARAYLYLTSLYNASAFLNNRYPDFVINLLDTAVKLSPNRTPIYFEYGQAYLYKKENLKAVEYFKKGVDLAPWVIDSHFTLAEVYILTGKLDEAQAEIDFIIKKNGGIRFLEDRFLMLANVLVKTKNYSYAVDIYKKILAVFPDNPNYHASLAGIYSQMGEKENALAEANIVLELDPASKESVQEFIDSLK